MHIPFHPQLFLRRFHKESRCFPHVRSNRQGKPLKDLVKKLSESVRFVLTHLGEDYAEQRRDMSSEVHENVQTILHFIEALAAEPEAGAAGHRSALLDAAVQLFEALVAEDLPMSLLQALPHFDFETRKDIMNMSCMLLRSGLPAHIDHFVVGYFREHPQVFDLVVQGYSNEEVALQYGVVLRSCARHRDLVTAFIDSGLMLELLKHTRDSSFDISTDAFCSVSEMLLEHKDVAAAWLLQHGGDFFEMLNDLLRSDVYTAQRQALKLLKEIVRDLKFCKVMRTYVNDEQNLKIVMNLLKDPSKAIQLDAFQLFVVFAANPDKSNKVHQILYRNRDKLISLTQGLAPAKPDPAFEKEQRLVVERLQQMQSPASSPRRIGVLSSSSSTCSSL